MRKGFPDNPEILRILKNTLQESLDVADTPNLPAVKLCLIIDGFCYQFRTRFIVHDLLVFLPVDMIEAKLLLLQLCKVISIPDTIIPLLFFVLIVSLLCYFRSLSIDPTQSIINWVILGVLMLKLWLQFHLQKYLGIHRLQALVRSILLKRDVLLP